MHRSNLFTSSLSIFDYVLVRLLLCLTQSTSTVVLCTMLNPANSIFTVVQKFLGQRTIMMTTTRKHPLDFTFTLLEWCCSLHVGSLVLVPTHLTHNRHKIYLQLDTLTTQCWMGWPPYRVEIPPRKVWQMPTARVQCSNATNIGECKTWMQN